MDQVWRLSTLLMSRVLAVCNNLLIFRLHFFGIKIALVLSPRQPSCLLDVYKQAADACSLSLDPSSASKAKSFRSSPMKTFHNSLPCSSCVPFASWDSPSGAEITSTVCYIPCQSSFVLLRCINISCCAWCINMSVPYCRCIVRLTAPNWELSAILCSTVMSSHLLYILV